MCNDDWSNGHADKIKLKNKELPTEMVAPCLSYDILIVFVSVWVHFVFNFIMGSGRA